MPLASTAIAAEVVTMTLSSTLYECKLQKLTLTNVLITVCKYCNDFKTQVIFRASVMTFVP